MSGPEQDSRSQPQPSAQLSLVKRAECSIASASPSVAGLLGVKFPTCEQYDRVLGDPLGQLVSVGNSNPALRNGYESLPDRTRRELAAAVVDRAIQPLPAGTRNLSQSEEPLAHQILGSSLTSLERDVVMHISRRVAQHRPDLAYQYEQQITEAGGGIPLLHQQANRYATETRRLGEDAQKKPK
ncbi:MAG: hypothetical protein IT290_09585 [Deltaproteobacteria bacterium]|nr:hypothetical protein [Deltaproteobacteria bacterium]